MSDTGLKRFLVLAMRKPTFDPAAAEAHLVFLADLKEQRLIEMTGPFADRSGGAYLLLAPDMATATRVVESDPLHITGSSVMTIHEWQAR
ncbi:uncharacterized protein YciI [Luteibacter rhizovicinus]|uniref:Uncharacterized protein YciI n=1 Tax=Luteibacter rhizovicinus TaxID=242606 RepID=A0A4R3YX16_9GAMM|nr:YciI family protein [Luteibacter rhizovicinus]TCV97150.1 uncharacterized protein YciI [Luteibacter rhizovicinus]